MAKTWILLVQGSKAKILAANKNSRSADTIEEFSHEETAKKDLDIHSDRQGRHFVSGSEARHAMDYNEDPKDHERNVFAKEIAEYLNKNLSTNQFSRLIVVSSPQILGSLRHNFSEPLKKIISHNLSKDLLSQNLKDHEICEKLLQDLDILHF